jgi:hypothetical protein
VFAQRTAERSPNAIPRTQHLSNDLRPSPQHAPGALRHDGILASTPAGTPLYETASTRPRSPAMPIRDDRTAMSMRQHVDRPRPPRPPLQLRRASRLGSRRPPFARKAHTSAASWQRSDCRLPLRRPFRAFRDCEGQLQDARGMTDAGLARQRADWSWMVLHPSGRPACCPKHPRLLARGRSRDKYRMTMRCRSKIETEHCDACQ